MSKRILALMVGLSLTGPAAVSAAPTPDNGQSKENPIFEAQGSGVISSLARGIARFVKENGILSNGIVTLQDSMVVGDETKQNAVDVGVETRIYGFQENLTPGDYAPGGLLVPIEVRVRAMTDGSGVSIKDLRIGLFRIVVSKIALTGQVLSWVRKEFDAGMGTYDALEFASITLSDVIDLSGSGTIELVYKATANIGMGKLHSAMPAVDALRVQDPEAFSGGGGSWSTYSAPAGSVGIRIAKKVLVDVFGGFIYAGTTNDKVVGHDQNGDNQYAYNGGTAINDKFWGVGLRYIPVKWLHLKASMQKDFYDVVYAREGGPRLHAKPTSVTYSVGAELHY